MSLAKMMGKPWPELFQDLIEAGLGKPLFGSGIALIGASVLWPLLGLSSVLPSGVILFLSLLSGAFLLLGAVILYRWARLFL